MQEDQRIGLLGKLVSGKDITRELLKRKKAYEYTSISSSKPELIKEMMGEGWEQEKEFKTKVKLRKLKSVDVRCEDRTWTLFALMGFNFMNRDRSFRLPYELKQNLTQQIDVFAKDSETVIIVECKSAQKTNRAI